MSGTDPRLDNVKVLSLGLPRTGSMSMAEALTILGYKHVFHAGVIWEHPERWAFFERAADAHFPSLATYTGNEFTLNDWNSMFGASEAITDVAAVFAEQMIRAYPHAKVIVVKRDFESWSRSYDESLLRMVFGMIPWISCTLAEPLLGSHLTTAMRKQTAGFLGCSDGDQARNRKVMLEKYNDHHSLICRLVPPENLLEMQLGEGWGPICAFLQKPTPESPFPHVNDSATLRAMIREKQLGFIREMLFTKLVPTFTSIAVLCIGIFMTWVWYRI